MDNNAELKQFEDTARKVLQTIGDNFVRGLAGDDYDFRHEPDDAKREAEQERRRQEESDLFSARHREALARIDADILRQIQPGVPEPLSPSEIRFLDRVCGSYVNDVRVAGCFTSEYQMDFKTVMEKLFSSGYLTFSAAVDHIKMAHIDTLRNLLKAKGLKAGGKRVDLIQRILDNYSAEELEALDFPDSYALTEAGRQLLDKNSALINFYLTFSHEWTAPENIIKAQEAYPNESGIDVLIRVLKEEIAQADKTSVKIPLYGFLRKLYYQKCDEESIQVVEAIIQQLNAEWEKERKARQESISES